VCDAGGRELCTPFWVHPTVGPGCTRPKLPACSPYRFPWRRQGKWCRARGNTCFWVCNAFSAHSSAPGLVCAAPILSRVYDAGGAVTRPYRVSSFSVASLHDNEKKNRIAIWLLHGCELPDSARATTVPTRVGAAVPKHSARPFGYAGVHTAAVARTCLSPVGAPGLAPLSGTYVRRPQSLLAHVARVLLANREALVWPEKALSPAVALHDRALVASWLLIAPPSPGHAAVSATAGSSERCSAGSSS